MAATCWQSKQLSLIPFAISWVDSGGLEGVLWVQSNKNIIQLVKQDASIKHICGPFTKSAYLITNIVSCRSVVQQGVQYLGLPGGPSKVGSIANTVSIKV